MTHHIGIKNDKTFDVEVRPTFRPDKGVRIDKEDYMPWLNKLEELHGKKIESLSEFKKALLERIEFFHEVGCRISDHALDPVVFEMGTEEEADRIFKKKISFSKKTSTD